MAAMSHGRTVKLAAVGTAAGLFSGLFGVGGGIIMVPLFILWLAYGEREATGTSLLAVILISLVGVFGQGAFGNVRVVEGLVIGAAGVVGVVGGTWLQQRVPTKAITLLFALMLAAAGVRLIVG
jgi:uncharacterized membrane protein YfcA